MQRSVICGDFTCAPGGWNSGNSIRSRSSGKPAVRKTSLKRSRNSIRGEVRQKLIRHRNIESQFMKCSQSFQRTGEHAFTTPGIMPGGIRIIQANAEIERMTDGHAAVPSCFRRLIKGSVALVSTRHGLIQQRVIEDTNYILIDKRFAPGEGKLFDAEIERLIHKRNNFFKAQQL